MANELSLSVSLSYNKNAVKFNIAEAIQVDVTGDSFTGEIQEVQTSESEILQGTELGTLGYVFIKNLDSTNYVEVGLTASYPIKLLAGQMCVFPANGDIYLKANTAACLCWTKAVEL